MALPALSNTEQLIIPHVNNLKSQLSTEGALISGILKSFIFLYINFYVKALNQLILINIYFDKLLIYQNHRLQMLIGHFRFHVTV